MRPCWNCSQILLCTLLPAGSIFARKHTQDEWEKIKKENRFKEETQKICPELNTGKLKEKQWKDLYDFSYKFAVGGEIPNGCDPK